MHKPSVPQLLYKTLFPRPRQTDPASFALHITRNLVPEVRLEVQTFYGALNSVEAQYPGLDYTFTPHRRRLARFPWHKRLFKAFDELRLTDEEILSICQWEGTKSAKDKYEKETGTVIEDTTADGIVVLTRTGGPIAYVNGNAKRRRTPRIYTPQHSMGEYQDVDSEAEEQQSEEGETDESIGMQLNAQLRAAADARARGEPAVFDEQWEQWMKEAMERNDLSVERTLSAIRDGQPFPIPSLPSSSSSSLSSASLGLSTAPTNSEGTRNAASRNTSASDATIRTTRQSIGNLQAALRNLQSTNARLAADNVALSRVLSRPSTEAAR